MLASPRSAATAEVATSATPSPPAFTPVNGTGKGLPRALHHRTISHNENSLLDQSPGDRRPGAGEDAGEGRSGYAHPLGGGFLVETFEIGQPQSLEFVQSQWLHFEVSDWPTDGLERPPPGNAADPSELFRSCHLTP